MGRGVRKERDLRDLCARIVDDLLSVRSDNAARVIGSHAGSRGAHVIVVVEGACARPEQLASEARDQLARRLNRARVASISVRCVGLGTLPEPTRSAREDDQEKNQ